ncbi:MULTISPECIES: hypothetical protein [unclassified Corallococcus]|uniref:hypothetical protein n=1 Tax=unclassified Corallococcus TaxID=2685029 RepID=UPI001A8CBD7B|nr:MULTISPECIES: hypothetical protein [unclassified Corallococcus]MBN9685552.1 hypothetical protein [Corallococcus sp. NCSPR001]WAS83000.1 hypothetical protein O0N60_27210 [Corallococcus sp. NCRR]
MIVRDALEHAKHWVDTEGSRIPGFMGAYVAGRMASLPLDTPFSTWRDVDLVVATSDAEQARASRLEMLHKGVIVECSVLDAALFQKFESVVSNPEHADNVREGRILADPTGAFQTLHEQVAREFPRRTWVKARCDSHRRAVLGHLEQAMQDAGAGAIPRMLLNFHAAMVYLSGLVALSHLKPITVRQCYVLSGELLERQGHAALHEECLALLGCADLSRQDVEGYLADFMKAFDRAVEVKKGDVPYGFKLRAHLRGAYLEGTREMIDAGRHRESLFWFFGLYFLALMVIQNDAPEAEKAAFQARFHAFFGRLGFLPNSPWAARFQQAKAVFEKISRAADEAIAGNTFLPD